MFFLVSCGLVLSQSQLHSSVLIANPHTVPVPTKMATATSTKISLKLLVDNNSKKVLFAEAGKDFVDFLFGLLELPLGSIMSLLVEHGLQVGPGSFGRIYKSVQDLDNSYLHQTAKDSLLRPKTAPSNANNASLLLQSAYKKEEPSRRRHHNPYNFEFHDESELVFDSFPRLLFLNGSEEVVEAGGYVKGVVTYMVMDDLEVKPTSTIASVTLLNTFQIRDMGCLQEITVQVDMEKGLELVKASFESTTVLTDVFLP